jgi:acetyl esterase/lipase
VSCLRRTRAAAGVDVELVLLPDVGHAFELKPLTGEEMTVALHALDAFLEKTLDS